MMRSWLMRPAVLSLFLSWLCVELLQIGQVPRSAAKSSRITQLQTDALVRLNEVLVSPLAGQFEFVEILNLSDTPVSLAGWSIDDFADNATVPLDLGNISLGPGEFLQIFTPNMFNNLPPDAVRLIEPGGGEADHF